MPILVLTVFPDGFAWRKLRLEASTDPIRRNGQLIRRRQVITHSIPTPGWVVVITLGVISLMMFVVAAVTDGTASSLLVFCQYHTRDRVSSRIRYSQDHEAPLAAMRN